VFDAAMFLAGAVLFLCSVVFFVLVWYDRAALVRRRRSLEQELQRLREERIDVEIREHELAVWQVSLDHEYRQLEQVREELRMLTMGEPTGPDPTELMRENGVGDLPSLDAQGGHGPVERGSVRRAKANKERSGPR